MKKHREKYLGNIEDYTTFSKKPWVPTMKCHASARCNIKNVEYDFRTTCQARMDNKTKEWKCPNSLSCVIIDSSHHSSDLIATMDMSADVIGEEAQGVDSKGSSIDSGGNTDGDDFDGNASGGDSGSVE